jgi:predicted TIM-barrel fold metal-dependent hydrolase
VEDQLDISTDMGESFTDGTDYRDFHVFTDYDIFDADQHLHEGVDCYTRNIEARFAERTIRIIEEGPDQGIVVDGQLRPSDRHDGLMARPGSLKEMLRGMKAGSGDVGGYQWMEPDPAFSSRDLRLAQLDRQRIDGCILYSNGPGLLADHLLTDDDLYYASSWSYLRYLEEEWGFSTDSRLYVAPVFSFRDVVRTGQQLDWFFEHGGRVVSFLPGPAYGRSPGDPHFDPLWRRISDAGAVVVYHINEAISGYKAGRSSVWGEPREPTFFTQSAWQWYWAYGDVPAQETFASLIYSNLFSRFPDLRVISAEHGCEWVPLFVRKLDKMRGMGRNGPWIGGALSERPSAVFKRHFRVIPFWEDSIDAVIDQVGHEVLINGSDFPHAEGLAFPTQMVEHLLSLEENERRDVMVGTGRGWIGR